MRHGAAALLVAAVAAALGGCAPGPSDALAADTDNLPTSVTTTGSQSDAAGRAEPAPTVTLDPEGAEPLSSIHRGPVEAAITAVREGDGAKLGVSVDVPSAVDADPLLTADCATDDGGALAIVVQDLAVDKGIATATLGVPAPLNGPGSYEGVVTFLDVDGEAIRGTGQVVVHDGRESGTFDVSDPGTGDHLIGSWECRSL